MLRCLVTSAFLILNIFSPLHHSFAQDIPQRACSRVTVIDILGAVGWSIESEVVELVNEAKDLNISASEYRSLCNDDTSAQGISSEENETETTETEPTEATETTSSQTTTTATQPTTAIAGGGLGSLGAVGLGLAVAGGGLGGGGASVADGTYRNTVDGSYLTEYNYQSMLSSINPLSLNDYGYTGLGVKVAVVDTGIDSSHSEFDGRTVYGKDFSTSASGYGNDEDGHGTHVASILAGDRDAAGMRGVAYDATIYDYKTDSNGDGNLDALTTDSQMAAVFNQHVTDNIDVSNNSWAAGNIVNSYTTSTVLSDYSQTISALKSAQANGTLIVFSSGNNGAGAFGADDPNLAAALPYHDSDLAGAWLVVTAVDSNLNETLYTNRCGVAWDFCVTAPGGGDSPSSDGILAAEANGSYVRYSGTSQAAPHVAGLAAALMEKFPSLTPAQIATRIKTTASYDNIYQYGGTAATSLSLTARRAIFGHGFINSTAAAARIGDYIYANGNDLTKGTNLSTTRLSLPSGLSASTQSQILGSNFIVFDSFDGARFSVDGNEVFEASTTSDAPSLGKVRTINAQQDESFGFIEDTVQVKPSNWAPKFISSGENKHMTATGTFWAEKASLFSNLPLLQSKSSTRFIWEQNINELNFQPFVQISDTDSLHQSIGAYGASFNVNMNSNLRAVTGFKTSNHIFKNGIFPETVSQGKLRDLEIGFIQDIDENENIFIRMTNSDVSDMTATNQSFGFTDASANSWTVGYETQSEIGTFVLGIAQPNQLSDGKASLITPTGRTKSGQILYRKSDFELSRDKNLERFFAYRYANDDLALSFGIVEDRYNYGELGAAKLDISLQF